MSLKCFFVRNINKETEHKTPDFTLADNVKKTIFIFDTSAVNIKNIDILYNEESKISNASNLIHCPQISQFLRTDVYIFNISLRHGDTHKANIVCN